MSLGLAATVFGTGATGSSSSQPATNKQQTVSVSLVASTQSYAITFSPALTAAPSYVSGSVFMVNNSGEEFDVAIDNSTVTANGCTAWLSGVPTSASTGATLKVLAIV